jgi:hypothetical protein
MTPLQSVLAALASALRTLDDLLPQLFPRPAYEVDPAVLPMNQDPPVTVVPTPLSMIKKWAIAIQKQEGGKPTDLNIRNNNPGNLKYTAYTASLGAKVAKRATDGGYFCYFDTYGKGFDALCQFLTDAANNKLAPFHDPATRTLYGFTQKYANPPKSHPYAQNVATELGVSVMIDISKLLG